ncbi:hypothetical protein ABPG72_008923 [Tetrahymena utriculariae]
MDQTDQAKNNKYFLKGIIVALIEEGNSLREASEKLDKFGFSVSKDKCQRIYRRWKDHGCIDDDPQGNRGGHNKSLQKQDEANLCTFAEMNPSIGLQKIKNNLLESCNKNVSQSTLRTTLKNHGFKPFVIPHILPLTQTHKLNRLDWGLKRQDYKSNYWSKVVFTDECILSKSCFRRFIWSKDKQSIPKDLCIEKNKWSLRIHVYGAISRDGPVSFQLLQGTIDSIAYIEVLKQFKKDCTKSPFIYQQDGARAHQSKATSEWLEENQFKLLDWPSHSPDLSPIENIWAILKDLIFMQENEPTNKNELFDLAKRIFFESEEIQSAIQECYDSIPQRIQDLIEREGDETDY